MRWYTAANESTEEREQRQRVRQQIDLWWQAFTASAPKIVEFFNSKGELRGFDLPSWMQDNLCCIDPHLCWEFGPPLRGTGHRLVITPESTRNLRPLTEEILRRAPILAGWEFYGHRPPESLDEAIECAKQRTQSELVVTGIDCSVGFSNHIALTCTARAKANDAELDLAFTQASIICTTLLGEETTDCWLGYIEVNPAKKAGSPLTMLKQQFADAINQSLQSLSSDPYWMHIENSEWSLFDFTQEKNPEQEQRTDLLVYRTVDTVFFDTIMSGVPFYSKRLSRCNERYCELKLVLESEGRKGLDEKTAIEDAIEAALTSMKLGCIIGAGMGTAYCYIDFVTTDIAKVSDIILKILRDRNSCADGWILFHDNEWHSEWISLNYDTEPPALTAPAVRTNSLN